MVLALVSLFSIAFLAGCALFALDVERNNNLIVARIATTTEGEYITISYRQLSDAFGGGWGNHFLQQGMDAETAVNRTLEALIDREIATYLSITRYFHGDEGATWEERISNSLTEREHQLALRNVLNSLQQSIDNMNRTVREENNMPDPEPPADQPGGRPVFIPHEHYIFVGEGTTTVTRNFHLNLDRFAEVPEDTTDRTIAQFLASAFAPRSETQTEISIANETRERLVRILRNREAGLNYTDDTWQDVMTREIERMMRDEKRRIHGQRFQDMFSQGMMAPNAQQNFLRFDNRFNDGMVTVPNPNYDPLNDNEPEYFIMSKLEYWQHHAQISSQPYVDNIVTRARDMYMRNVRSAMLEFQMGSTTVDTIREQIIQPNALENIHWLPQSMANDYFTVSHILISFPDEDQARATQLANQLRNQQIDQDFFDAQMLLLRDRLTIRPRDAQGHEVGTPLTPTQVLSEVSAAVNGMPSNRPLAFREQIYRFNGDPGMENPRFEYVIGVDLGETIVTSQMVPEFTDSARALHATGVRGSMSGLVWSQFGAHIIMYTRNVNEFVMVGGNSGNLPQQYHNFLFQTETSYGNRTFFDSIIGQLTRGEYQEAERNMLISFRQEINANGRGITTWPSRFRSLWRD